MSIPSGMRLDVIAKLFLPVVALLLPGGSMAGLFPATNWTSMGEASGSAYGYALANAGDINGDGFDDALVGALGAGKTYLFHGGAAGLPAITNWTAHGQVGDNQFGMTVAGAGDVNHDSYDDILVAAPYFSEYDGRGKACLFFGSATGLHGSASWIATGEAAGEKFGLAMDGAGDVNGDNYADVIVTALDHDSQRGKAYLFLGEASGLSTETNWVMPGENMADRFGSAAAGVGDVNQDGYDDVIVAAEEYSTQRGKAYVFLGGTNGLGASAQWSFTGENEGDYFGAFCAGAGDVNGDGYDDILVGAQSYPAGNSRGKAYVFLGSALGVQSSAHWSVVGSEDWELTGRGVAGAGDVNGDGYADILVGSDGYSGLRGRAAVYLGGPAGVSTTAIVAAIGENASDRMGFCLGSGDFNGDGYSDLLVGADAYTNGIGWGKVYELNGGPHGVSPARGPATGGTTVTITNGLMGAGDITNVVAGGISTTNIPAQGANWARVVMPAHALGPADVVVQSALLGETLFSQAYLYDPPGVIESISPAAGSVTGGYAVVIAGQDLGKDGDITNVTLCGVVASIQSQSSTQVVVMAGIGRAGTGDVVVTSLEYGLSRRTNAFAYVSAGDRYEYDNAAEYAYALPPGTEQMDRTIHEDGDQDYVRLATISGHAYRVSMTNLSLEIPSVGPGYAQLALYDDSGTNRLDYIFDERLARLEFQSQSGAVYYARAYTDAGATGAYGLALADLGTGDAFEPDDEYLQAKILPLETNQPHTLHWSWDMDYVTFTGAARHVFAIQAPVYEGLVALQLLDTDGQTPLYSEISMFEDLYFEFLLNQSALYYLRMAPAYGPAGDYEFQVNDLGFSPGDAYEIDDAMDQASNIVNGASQARSIHWMGDLDYIRFDAAPYHAYAIRMTNVAGTLDASLQLYDAETNLLSGVDGGGTGEDETITQLLYQAGAHFIRTANSWSETGAYEIVLLDVGAVTADAYEPDNVFTQAAAMAVDVPQADRTLHTTSDVDFVRVTLNALRYYRFEVRNLQYGLEASLALLATNGATVLAEGQSASPDAGIMLEHFIETPGDYYLKVTSVGEESAGVYTLAAQDTRIRRKWFLGAGADVYASPSVADNGTVYAGTANGRLYGLALDGSTSGVWRLPGPVHSSALIGPQGLLYAMASNRVFCLDPATGGTNWVYTNEFGGITRSSPALGTNGVLYAPMFDYRLHALDAATGGTQWLFNSFGGTFMESAPSIGRDGTVYWGRDNSKLYALAAAGGGLWTSTLDSAIKGPPALADDGHILVATFTGGVYELTASGAVTQRWDVSGMVDYSAPVIGPQGDIYQATLDGRLYSFRRDGGTNWVVQLPAGFQQSSPVVGADGTVYLSTGTNRYFMAVGPDGSLGFTWDLGAGISAGRSTPAMDTNGLIYVGAYGGWVYALYGNTWPTGGLAASPWPMAQADAKRTGCAADTDWEARFELRGTNAAAIENNESPSVAKGTLFNYNTQGYPAQTNIYMITNSGTLALNVTSLATNGSTTAVFRVVSWPAFVPAGANAPLVVALDTGITGLHTAQVIVTHSGTNSPFLLNLRGTIEPDMMSIWFPTQKVNGVERNVFSRHNWSVRQALDDLRSILRADTNLPAVIVRFGGYPGYDPAFTNGNLALLEDALDYLLDEFPHAPDVFANSLAVGEKSFIDQYGNYFTTTEPDQYEPLPFTNTYEVILEAGRHTAAAGIAALLENVELVGHCQRFRIRASDNTRTQAIAFAAIPTQTEASLLQLSATASSGLPVGYTNLAGSPVVWLNATTITFNGAGQATLVAAQAGNVDYLPATPVTNTFRVLGYFAVTIESPHGATLPATGVYTNLELSVFTNQVLTPDVQGTTQYLCYGWVATENLDPAGGFGTQAVVTVNGAGSLTWLWTTEYYLTPSAGPHGTIDRIAGWFTNGAVVSINATPDQYYHFTNWTGSILSMDNPLHLLMDGAKWVTANFAANWTTNRPTPEWWLAQYGITNDLENAVDGDPDNDWFPTGDEFIANTDPTNDLSYFHVAIMALPGGENTMGWPCSTGRVYALQYGLPLPPGTWAPVEGMTNLVPSGSWMFITNDLDGSALRLYRVQVRRPE